MRARERESIRFPSKITILRVYSAAVTLYSQTHTATTTTARVSRLRKSPANLRTGSGPPYRIVHSRTRIARSATRSQLDELPFAAIPPPLPKRNKKVKNQEPRSRHARRPRTGGAGLIRKTARAARTAGGLAALPFLDSRRFEIVTEREGASWDILIDRFPCPGSSRPLPLSLEPLLKLLSFRRSQRFREVAFEMSRPTRWRDDSAQHQWVLRRRRRITRGRTYHSNPRVGRQGNSDASRVQSVR